MTNSQILIKYDYSDGDEYSYGEIKSLLLEAQADPDAYMTYRTLCLDFFNFDYLKVCRDVLVWKSNGKYISLRELLNGDKFYTEKAISHHHNAHKMLIAGSFNWKEYD